MAFKKECRLKLFSLRNLQRVYNHKTTKRLSGRTGKAAVAAKTLAVEVAPRQKTLDSVKLLEYMNITWFINQKRFQWTEAAGAIRDGVRACTALYFLSHLSPGKSVLIMDGASAFGTIAIQLAHHRGAKVISTACSLEDKQHLERMRPSIARVIDVNNGKVHVAESCLEETGGLGADIVIDAGVRLYSKDDEPALKLQLPHKHDIITLLGVGEYLAVSSAKQELEEPSHLAKFSGHLPMGPACLFYTTYWLFFNALAVPAPSNWFFSLQLILCGNVLTDTVNIQEDRGDIHSFLLIAFMEGYLLHGTHDLASPKSQRIL
ncbi:hypothetical protein STEG23_014346 [Scotinomys teguina]